MICSWDQINTKMAGRLLTSAVQANQYVCSHYWSIKCERNHAALVPGSGHVHSRAHLSQAQPIVSLLRLLHKGGLGTREALSSNSELPLDHINILA